MTYVYLKPSIARTSMQLAFANANERYRPSELTRGVAWPSSDDGQQALSFFVESCVVNQKYDFDHRERRRDPVKAVSD
ncbi:hypothetical protein [Rhodopseudomonas palustris]|uniref:hypothetical protein n=1 Tax=Rhodopseudomonas palustris TaxID=1076 RepID=UPI0013050126|nr:hypothetical protein [Rhodopseudomonas palustris]